MRTRLRWSCFQGNLCALGGEFESRTRNLRGGAGGGFVVSVEQGGLITTTLALLLASISDGNANQVKVQ